MKTREVLMILPFFLAGCGPSVHSLVQAKHYREAVCAAQDGTTDDQDLVARALDKDADIYVHVHTVSESEMQSVLGLDAPGALDRGRIVRIGLQSNILPLDDVELEAKLVTSDGKTAAIPADWPTLAWLTHEKLPAKRTAETYVTAENFFKSFGVLFTAGFILLFTDFKPQTYQVDAPLWEFKQSAPHAYAIHETTQTSGCRNLAGAKAAGKNCSFYLILDSVSKIPVSLQIDARYVSLRQTKSSTGDGKDRCIVPRSAQIALGTPQEFEKMTREQFGDRMVPVRSLIRSK